MQIPHIEIRLQHAKLNIDADIGQQEIQQPNAEVQMEQTQPVLHISKTKSELEINQDRVWDALGLGNNLETMNKIYSMASDIALRGLARIVEKGNRMAEIHIKGNNPIADDALEWKRTFPEFDFRGEASYLNVDIRYTPSELKIETTPGHYEYQVQVNRPIHHYERGKLDIYLSQYPKVDIIPPQINGLY